MKYKIKEIIGIILSYIFYPHISTDLEGEITRGYGKLDNNGYWEYPYSRKI